MVARPGRLIEVNFVARSEAVRVAELPPVHEVMDSPRQEVIEVKFIDDSVELIDGEHAGNSLGIRCPWVERCITDEVRLVRAFTAGEDVFRDDSREVATGIDGDGERDDAVRGNAG